MIARPEPNCPPSDGLKLVVSTWHIARLHNGRPEGLPSDLLTQHSALFYLVDRVVCDRFGLKGELKWKDYWLSAKIFQKLKDQCLLEEVDIHDEPFLPRDFWVRLSASTVGQRASYLLDEMSERAKNRSTARSGSIPEELHRLNRTLFLSLRTPPRTLLYYPTDGLFQGKPVRQVDLVGVPDASAGEMRWRGQRLSRLIEIVKRHLPDPRLLPRIDDPAVKGALTRIQNSEKSDLYQVLGGKLSHDEFQDRRRDRKRFLPWDQLVDSEAREKEADANFDRMIKIREQTRDLRQELQRLVLQIVDGEIPMRDASRLLNAQVSAFRNHVYGSFPRLYQAARFVAVDLSGELFDLYAPATISLYPEMGLLGPSLERQNILEGIDHAYVQPLLVQRMYAQARSDFPLGAFDHHLRQLLQEGFRFGDSVQP